MELLCDFLGGKGGRAIRLERLPRVVKNIAQPRIGAQVCRTSSKTAGVRHYPMRNER